MNDRTQVLWIVSLFNRFDKAGMAPMERVYHDQDSALASFDYYVRERENNNHYRIVCDRVITKLREEGETTTVLNEIRFTLVSFNAGA